MIRTKPIPLSESRPLGLLGKIKSSSSVEAVCVGNGKRKKKNKRKHARASCPAHTRAHAQPKSTWYRTVTGQGRAGQGEKRQGQGNKKVSSVPR